MSREQRLLEAVEGMTKAISADQSKGELIAHYTDLAWSALHDYHAASAEGPGDGELREKSFRKFVETAPCGIRLGEMQGVREAHDRIWMMARASGYNAARAHTPKGQDDTAEENGERAEFWKKKYFELKGQGAEFPEEFFVEIIMQWRMFWMNQTQNSTADRDNYRHRALGVDANMKYDLAKRIQKALASRPKAEGRDDCTVGPLYFCRWVSPELSREIAAKLNADLEKVRAGKYGV